MSDQEDVCGSHGSPKTRLLPTGAQRFGQAELEATSHRLKEKSSPSKKTQTLKSHLPAQRFPFDDPKAKPASREV
jgi:hypothetical protein